jgi:hypothetical protein
VGVTIGAAPCSSAVGVGEGGAGSITVGVTVGLVGDGGDVDVGNGVGKDSWVVAGVWLKLVAAGDGPPSSDGSTSAGTHAPKSITRSNKKTTLDNRSEFTVVNISLHRSSCEYAVPVLHCTK